MQPDTYMLLHRMVCASTTQDDLEIVLRRFQEVVDITRDSAHGEDMFDGAWAMSCMAGVYAQLGEPSLAQQAYREAIKLFDGNDMSFNASAIRVALTRFLTERGRFEEAEDTLKQNMVSLIKHWGVADHRVLAAEEELRHFQLTGEVIEAYRHSICQACDIGGYGVDFEDIDRAGR